MNKTTSTGFLREQLDAEWEEFANERRVGEAGYHGGPACGLQRNQTAPDGNRNRLGAAGGVEFVKDRSDMKFDRVL